MLHEHVDENTQQVEGRKDKTRIQKSKTKEGEVCDIFGTPCVCMHLAITSALWNSQQLPKMLTLLWWLSSPPDIQFFTSTQPSDCSVSSSAVEDSTGCWSFRSCVLESTDQSCVLGLNVWLPYNQSPNLNFQRPSSFLSLLSVSQGHGSLCGLRVKIDEQRRPSRYFDAGQRCWR